ncbi:MAG: hypothetical protein ACXWDJ_09655 [Aeromicrobium sp.]
MPIFQVLLLIGYLKIADRVRAYFTPNPAATHPHPGKHPETTHPSKKESS